ncbi:class I SAM-dependent methyltransferase [Planctomycetota bacterium]|nr:class I SAM-dependent methyltransferase [Planctomycetota bacterium]
MSTATSVSRMSMITITRKIKNKFLNNAAPQKDYTQWNGYRLPMPENRYCTPEFKDDNYFVNSSKKEVDRLVEYANLKEGSRVLDIGSGQGRLAIGLAHFFPKLDSYFGLDVDRHSVDWCKRNISSVQENFNFLHLDIENERYNPNGYKLDTPVQLPFKDNSFDIIFLYSVFTHMRSKDVKFYLSEIKRMLAKDSYVLFTAYSEENCENESENPKGYLEDEYGQSLGALHRIRFSQSYWTEMIDDAGFRIDNFFHQCEKVTKQSIYIIKHK